MRIHGAVAKKLVCGSVKVRRPAFRYYIHLTAAGSSDFGPVRAGLDYFDPQIMPFCCEYLSLDFDCVLIWSQTRELELAAGAGRRVSYSARLRASRANLRTGNYIRARIGDDAIHGCQIALPGQQT